MLGQAKQDPVAVIVCALGRSRAKTLALDHLSAAHAAAAALSAVDLRAHIDQAAALLQHRPSVTAQTSTAELRQDQARLRGYQREELSWLADAHDRLAQGGLRRGERRHLLAAIAQRQEAATQLGRRLDQVDQRVRLRPEALFMSFQHRVVVQQ